MTQVITSTPGMTLEEAIKKVPAIDGKPIEGVSDKYAFVPTKNIIKSFLDAGFHIVDAKNGFARGEKAKNPSAQHFITLENRHLISYETGDPYQLTILNSHDRSTKLQINFGIYRLVCSNGLKMFSSTIKPYKFKHVDFHNRPIDSIVDESISYILNQIQIIETELQKWQQTKLSQPLQESLALDFLMIRHDNKSPKDFTKKNLQQLLAVHRSEDEGDDVWRVFNRMQENLIQGNYTFPFRSHGKFQGEKKASQIKDPRRDLMINKQIWEVTSDLVAGI